ncbi:MAG: fructoselysine 6-kinase, partial [Lachnospiraceae bacterium]|nr:fructoselysine 6-kinase [Lachnospiraceae bacterium]
THVSIQDGDRVLGEYEEGVMADYAPGPEDVSFMKNHDLAVTGLWGHGETLLKMLRSCGVTTVFDAADRPDDPAAQTALGSTDIFFFSEGDDSGVMTEKEGGSQDADALILREKLYKLQQQGPRLVVATRGEKGSMAFDGQQYYACGIVPCKVVDTMGAGDSYIAGFLHAWLDQKPIPACMEAGAASSARTLSCAGAW